jgi:hypothetical protein
MPLIFAGIDLAQRSRSIVGVFSLMMLTLFAAGAVVGAIHGAFLVRLAQEQQPPHEAI